MQSPEVLQRLDALGAKLNVTAAHLWGVLVKQAHVELAQGVMLVGVTLVALIIWRVAYKWGRPKPGAYGWDEGPLVVCVILGVVAGLTAIITIVQLVAAVGYTMNPEYFALTRVLDAIR